MNRLFITAVTLAFAGVVQAFNVSTLFTDDMVLQRDKPIRVTGGGAPGEKVRVTFDGETVEAVAGARGRWQAMLKARGASTEGRTLVVTDGTATNVFKRVLVGDVWVCAGQSNMQFNMAWGDMYNVKAFKMLAETNAPYFRGVDIKRRNSHFPTIEEELDGPGRKWNKMDRKVGEISACGFVFGLRLSLARPDVPIGLISLALGGSRIEQWIPMDGYDGVKGLEEEAAASELYDFGKPKGRAVMNERLDAIVAWADGFAKLGSGDFPYAPMPMLPRTPGGHAMLYNGVMAPLEVFPFKGVIWYQGESNEDDRKYGQRQRALVLSWRRRFGADMPFYAVQLPDFGKRNRPGDLKMRGFAMVRILQGESLDLPYFGLAVTIDTNDTNTLHPRNKQDVSDRLALMALNDLYDRPQVNEGRSPFFAKAVSSEDGKTVTISFSHAEGGLANGTKKPGVDPVLNNGTGVKGLVVTDVKGHDSLPSSAEIVGETFVVTSVHPIAKIRYNCFAVPEAVVYSKASKLPVGPFNVSVKK